MSYETKKIAFATKLGYRRSYKGYRPVMKVTASGRGDLDKNISAVPVRDSGDEALRPHSFALHSQSDFFRFFSIRRLRAA